MVDVFVYGALMGHPHLVTRGRAACVRDHAVRFVVHGLWPVEPSFAALEPAPGEVAWGVVASWQDDAWRRARRREVGYREGVVTAESTDGRLVEAISLFVGPRARVAERTPSARYADLLVRGAERHGLPAEVVDRYRALRARGPSLTLRLARLLRGR